MPNTNPPKDPYQSFIDCVTEQCPDLLPAEALEGVVCVAKALPGTGGVTDRMVAAAIIIQACKPSP